MRRTAGTLVVVAVMVVSGLGAVVGARWLVEEVRPDRCLVKVGDTTVRLTPEQTANAATIAAVSVGRGLPPRAATVALATAIQESKLRNLRYGDADSQGLFQQRPSQGWGSVEEVTDPVHATGSFYDALVEVPGWETGVVTEMAQEVQRSAFPEAYADHEQEGRALASVLTGQEGAGTLMTCRLADRGAGDPVGLVTALQEQFGTAVAVADPGPETGTVTVTAGDTAAAWAVATWAVAHADARGVLGVTVGDRRWVRDRSALEWDVLEQAGPATEVVVELG
ncbi:hypothetical protein [uncultured Ornithinimicrobium sp.]|uniref:hypothetical protein n=1 Tax=uncultured Ornithinimicrobium sp. TaxID=259307 RepID=UPI0025988F35|nr:hypothetical protein [uncultured Ornithinimicrobium sp.]